jgi:murein hydrolase activator
VRFLVVLACFCVAFAAQAAPDSGRQDDLKDLRARIKALQEDLEQANEDKSEVADALKHSERRISDVNRGLRDLELRQRKLSQALKQLAGETKSSEAEIVAQQQRLAELLRERYARGESDAMRLLLNGQNPGEIARNIEYYGYIGRARAELIRQHRASLEHLRTLQEKTRAQNADLLKIKEARVVQKKTLEAEKEARQQVLYKLSSQIRQQRKQIDTLVRNEQRLTQLIERLARLAASKPKPKPRPPAEPAPETPRKPGQMVKAVADASQAGVSFSRLKGKLALPVAGEILNKFGQNRDDGGPVWKGLFIRARQGDEVRSVGSGEVAFADWLRGFGNLLIIDHGNGYLSLYSNNESLYKQPGDSVRAGDVVASVGSTGGQNEPGLYFELRRQGKPFDPLTWVR